jgi:hypothetical protein
MKEVLTSIKLFHQNTATHLGGFVFSVEWRKQIFFLSSGVERRSHVLLPCPREQNRLAVSRGIYERKRIWDRQDNSRHLHRT